MPVTTPWVALSILLMPAALNGQVIALSDAVATAADNNRAIRSAELQREKAVEDLRIARTQRLPVFSVTTLVSQPITLGGVTFERGALGVYPGVGPIPGTTTTLESPLQPGLIFFGSVAQPLTQQHRIGLGIDLAGVGVEVASEQIRATRQATTNEVRRLYYGIVQAESARQRLQSTISFLEQLNRETRQNVSQRVALEADLLGAGAQLAQAKYELLKLDDPIQSQKQQLNRLMGRDVDAPFDVDPASVTNVEQVSLSDACAMALESRPEIRSARLKVRKTELERRIKSAERVPDVSLSLTGFKTANFSSVLPNNISSVGIQVTWDVFDWGRKRQEIEAGRDTEQQATLDLREAEAQIRIDVAHQYRRVLEAQQELEVAKALQATGAESLRVVRNRFAQRAGLLSDVLKVQSTLADADHHLVQALMNLASAQADFDRAVGNDR
ncbi:MAG TPA: TolC family protein [Vicinamibacterales bacterium]|nr:TolC family protein [Vicinamibacterales bacterium]